MKPGLIIGSAECLDDDLEELGQHFDLEDTFTTIAINDGGVLWAGRLDHWVTKHPDELPDRRLERERRHGQFSPGYTTWGSEGDVDAVVSRDYVVDDMGSLGLALGVARQEGALPVVLVGCPLSDERYALSHPNHGNGAWPHWRIYQGHFDSALKRYPWIRGQVFSMSGYTRDVLGAPPPTLLNPQRKEVSSES